METLRSEAQKWKGQVQGLEISLGLCEQHLDEVKQSRMELRQQVEALQAELKQARRPWWKR